jgi:hypothetical protein
MSYDEHQAMWPQMIRALAAIDEALGLPEDGCNSLAQTLAAIARHRDALRDLANAADAVGVRHFNSDDPSPEVQALQLATGAARLALGPN